MTDWLSVDLRSTIGALALAAGQAGLRVAAALVGGYLAVRFLRAAIGRVETMLIAAGQRAETVPGAARKRVATLTGVLRTLVLVLVWAVVAMVCLSQLGFDVTPIVAGAGIVGLAVGFGAQNLVRDVITGFFIVLENQVRVGDVAVVNGTGGLVEAITFRTIVLRDVAGVVHVFPHGAVTTLANMTMGWSAYVIDVGVAYEEDTDRVALVMRAVADEMRGAPAFGAMILEPIEVLGVDDFKESGLVIKARLKTAPMQQWVVGREYRRRLLKAFAAAGIEIPFARRALRLVEATRPFEVVVKQAAPDAGRGPATTG